VQCSSFLAHRPSNDRSFAPVNGRQVGTGGGGGGGGGGRAAPPPPQKQSGGNSGGGTKPGYTPPAPQQNYSW